MTRFIGKGAALVGEWYRARSHVCVDPYCARRGRCVRLDEPRA